jgi:hypothetical protein
MLNLFLIFILSHLLTDFVLQSESLVKRKLSNNKKESCSALFIHSLYFFVASIVIYIVFKGISTFCILFYAFVLSISHYIIDLLKIKVIEYRRNKESNDNFLFENSLMIFLLDQLLHIALIIIITMAYYSKLQVVLDVFPLMVFFKKITLIISQYKFSESEKVMMTLCLLIIVTNFSNIFIKESLSSIKLKLLEEKEEVKIGRYIGSVERLLTVAAVMAGAYQALAALYASKTAIRFNQVKDNPEFGEYYILGTSISAALGILAGFALKIIWTTL